MSEGKEKLLGCARFGTDTVDVLYSVSTLSVRKCAHPESELSSLSTFSVLLKRLLGLSVSTVSILSVLGSEDFSIHLAITAHRLVG
jgi:hypothetical protein